MCYSDFRGFHKSDVNFKSAVVIKKKLIRNCEKQIYADELKNFKKERRLMRKIIMEKSVLLKDLDAEIKL